MQLKAKLAWYDGDDDNYDGDDDDDNDINGVQY